MTYTAGDDATFTIPVIDSNGGALEIPASVRAHDGELSDPSTTKIPITAQWDGPAVALPRPADLDSEAPTPTSRPLAIPLASLTPGIWGLMLLIEGDEDAFLDNIYIQ